MSDSSRASWTGPGGGGEGDETATLSTALDEKACQIEAILAKPTVDLWELRELALTEGGLVHDSIRQRAWPAFVGLHTAAALDLLRDDTPPTKDHNNNRNPETKQPERLPNDNTAEERSPPGDATVSTGKKNASYDAQVELDVARCTWHLLTGTQRIQKLQMEHKRHKRIARIIRKKQRRLASCIQRTLQASDNRLHYYQGYHDIACVILSTLRDASPPRKWTATASNETQDEQVKTWSLLDLPSAVLLQVSQSHLLDNMQETFQPLQNCLTLTLFPLVALLDAPVHQHLTNCDMAPFFALPWVLTWFSHEIRDTALVKRLFDAFLASHPALPLYVCVAMMLHPYNRQQILDTPCDFSSLHQTLVGLPKHSSAFGWRYQPGQGYVSDHEQDDDTDSLQSMNSEVRSTSSGGGGSNRPTEGEMVLLQEGILLDKHGGGAAQGSNPRTTGMHTRQPSLLSSSGGGMEDVVSVSSALSALQTTAGSVDENAATKVPFQELLDLAVQYMHRMPPRRLLVLAQRYYGVEHVQEVLQSSSTTTSTTSTLSAVPSMLKDPAPWVLSPTAPAEWWLRARVRERQGLAPSRSSRNAALVRKQRPSESSDSQRTAQQQEEHSSKETISSSLSNAKSSQGDFCRVSPREYVKLLRRRRRTSSLLAPLASGMALSIPEEKRKRQHERFLGIVVSVLILAFALWRTVMFPIKDSKRNSASNDQTVAASKTDSSSSQHETSHVPSERGPEEPIPEICVATSQDDENEDACLAPS